MKFEFAIFAMLMSSSSLASQTFVNCQAIRILDDNVFEESLSIEEYPDVSIEYDRGVLIAHMGAYVYKDGQGYRVGPASFPSSIGKFKYVIEGVETGEIITFEGQTQTSRAGRQTRARIFFRGSLEAQELLVAELVCDKP